MSAFVIADVDVHDATAYEAYRYAVPATIATYGGKVVVRGGKVDLLEGDWQPRRIVVIEFESRDRAKQWYDSQEYQAILPIRLRAAESKVLIVEGA